MVQTAYHAAQMIRYVTEGMQLPSSSRSIALATSTHGELTDHGDRFRLEPVVWTMVRNVDWNRDY